MAKLSVFQARLEVAVHVRSVIDAIKDGQVKKMLTGKASGMITLSLSDNP